jgi:type II secretory pathway pseudopilin PulG
LIKQERGFTLVEVLLIVVIAGIITPMVYRLFMVPFITQAKAINFQEAELTASLYALRSSKGGELLEEVPNDCVVEVEDKEFGVHTIECFSGFGQTKAKAKSNIFLQNVNLFTGDFEDTNGDGYEDVTGLPTHYDECYSGWKGAEGTKAGSSGGFKTSCELGGMYLIPMFSELYSETTLP